MVLSFENIVPIIYRESNVCVNRNGDMTLAYKFEGVDLCSKTKEEIEKLTDDFASSFTYFSDRTVIHKQDVFLKDYIDVDAAKATNYLTKAYLEEYRNKQYFRNDCYLFATRTSALSAQRDYGMGRNGKKYETYELASNQRKAIDLFEQELNGWIAFLNTQGVRLTPLKQSEFDNVIEGWFSLYDEDFIGDIDFKDKAIGLNNFNIISVGDGEQLPDSIEAAKLNGEYARFKEVVDGKIVGLYSDFLSSLGYGLKANHVVNQLFFMDGKEYMRNSIERLRKNFGSWRLFSSENSMNADALMEFERETFARNELIIRAHVNVLFWSNKNTDAVTEEIRAKFKESGIMGRAANKIDVRHIYLASCPGNAGTLPYEDTFLGHASALCALVIKESVRIGDLGGKGILFTDRNSGSLIRRDCWHEPYEKKKITNRNWLGIGKSGSGKSSMTIEVIRQYMEMDFNCTVLDIGRSFEVLAKGHGGNYFVYEDGVELGVNPYSFKTNEATVEEIEFLTSFTGALWIPNASLSDVQNDVLEKIILASYGAKRKLKGEAGEGGKDTGYVLSGSYENTSITDLYRFVQDNKSVVEEITRSNKEYFDRDSFLISMDKFVAGKGKFDRLLSGKNNVDTTKLLTVWELDNIKDHAILFPIISMLIMYLTTNVVWKQTSKEKIVLIEEAWKMLEKPSMAGYIKWLYKTIRKFDGAVGVNIQQASDLVVSGSNIKDTVLANSDVKFIMSHTVPMARELAKIMDWDDYQLALLLSICLDEEKLKGGKRFSELVSVVGRDIKALRLQVSKEQIVNFMSEMKDKEKLFALVAKNGGNYEYGIKEYVSLYFNK